MVSLARAPRLRELWIYDMGFEDVFFYPEEIFCPEEAKLLSLKTLIIHPYRPYKEYCERLEVSSP